ncbi:ribonuclease HII [Lederbergia lenta]|uniref:ribonuclease HII n=1 Tax=Lederbergia lenta TaxID=1467 RepID=UPI0020424020|nr:ribonuclease HII [Lederbergia lenta]MCM3110171.1 ribonuclease HII [Lederbergia lenta]
MRSIAIKEIKEMLTNITDENDPLLTELANDSRKGAQSLLQKWKREKSAQVKDKERFVRMTEHEQEARIEGYEWIAGIDEAGRGPLAGPVVSAAVILTPDSYIEGLNDSKKVSEKNRARLYEAIMREAIAVGVGIIQSEEIDQVNIYEAAKKSMLSAVQNLPKKPDMLFIDAMTLNSIYPEKTFIKGDAISVSIAAASIIAKVTRDRIMEKYNEQYPEYGFSSHMGYGTKSHIEAIQAFGPCPIHRISFEPIKSLIK